MYIFSYPDLMESQKLAFKRKPADLLFAANNTRKQDSYWSLYNNYLPFSQLGWWKTNKSYGLSEIYQIRILFLFHCLRFILNLSEILTTKPMSAHLHMGQYQQSLSWYSYFAKFFPYIHLVVQKEDRQRATFYFHADIITGHKTQKKKK